MLPGLLDRSGLGSPRDRPERLDLESGGDLVPASSSDLPLLTGRRASSELTQPDLQLTACSYLPACLMAYLLSEVGAQRIHFVCQPFASSTIRCHLYQQDALSNVHLTPVNACMFSNADWISIDRIEP